MLAQLARTTLSAAALAAVAARGAQAQKGAHAEVCSTEPVRSLIAYLLDETSPHDRAGGLHLGQQVGRAGCAGNGTGLEQPRFLDAPVAADVVPVTQGDVVTVVTGAISNPIAAGAVATGAAAAWVAAGASVTTSVLSNGGSAAPVASVGAENVIVNPEPATVGLMLSGLAGIGWVVRRRVR